MAGKLFKQYKEDQGSGNSSLYQKYKNSVDSGLSTGNTTMDRYVEHRRQQEEAAKERKKLRDARVNRENRERQLKNTEINKNRASATDFLRQERESLQTEHQLANPRALRNEAARSNMAKAANERRRNKENERKEYETQKAQDAKGVTENGIFKDGLTRFTSYEDIAKRPDFRSGAYQGAKDDKNPIGTGNTMKGFWSDPIGGLKRNNHSFQAMTADQKTMYNYLFSRYGADQADKYASSIDEELNMRAGSQAAEAVAKTGKIPAVGLNMLASAGSGTDRAVKGLGQAVDMVTGNYKTAPASTFDGYLQHLQENSSGIEKVAYDLTNSTGFMLPSMLAAPAAGAALGTTAGSAFGSAMFGAAAGGNSYTDAIREGQDVEAAQMYGALNAASETVTQAFLGGLNNVSLGHPRVKSAIDTAVRKLVSNPIARDTIKQVAGYGADMAAEGLQEYTQELLDKASRNMLFGENNQISLADPEAWYAAMLGALNAGVLNAPGAIAQELDYRAEGKRNVPEYQDFVEGIDTDSTYAAFETQKEARDLQDLARRYAERQENGESISNRENGRFLERMAEFAENVQQDENISQNQEENAQIPPENEQTVEDNNQNATENVMPDVEDDIDLKNTESPEQINPEEQVNTSEKTNISNETSQSDREFLDELSAKYGTSGMNAYLDNYDHTTDLNQYSRSFDRVYDAGRYGLKMEEGIHREALSTLGRDTLEKIWLAGAEDRNVDISKVNERTGEPLNMTKGDPRTGGLASAVENATPQQKAVATYMGERTGLQIELVDGMDQSGTTASYQKGKITLDVNSKDFLGSMGHELTHFIREMDPDNYRAYSETVAKAIMKSEGMDLEEGINSYIDRYLAQTGQELNRDQAVEEMVADASQKFFNDEEFIKEVTANKTLGQKILDFIDDVIDAIKSLIKTGSTRQSAKALEENMVYFQRARRAYMAGLEAASERYKAGYDVVGDTKTKYKLNEFGLEEYSDNDKARYANGSIQFCNTKEDIVEFCEKHVHKKPYARLYMGKIGTELAAKLHRDVGLELEGYNVAMTSEFENSHADSKKETTRGQIPVTPEMIADIPEIISSYDKVSSAGTTEMGKPALKFEKNINGKRVAIEYVSDKRKMLTLQTMYAWGEKKGSVPTATDISVAPIPSDTSKTLSGIAPTNNIKQSEQEIKTKFQLKDPVEETDTLIAAHNLSEDKLMKMLETVTYDPDVEGARNKAVNSVENIRFQMEDIDEYTNEKDVKKLLKENEDLKEANELLKKEFTLTAKEELRQDDIKKVCRKILKEYNSKAKLDPLVSNVTKLFEYVRTGENVDWDEFNNVATDIGKSILNKAEQKDTALTEQYKDLRKQIKDTKIMITDQDKADLAATGGYNDFRRKYFGRMSLGKTGISVDSLYQELASQHPDLFDADITHPADQLMQIGNVLDMTQPQIANPYHANMDEMAYHVGQELLQEYQNVRLVPPTFADRKAAELNKVRRQYNEKLENYKQKTETQYSALLNEARRENADMQEAHARDLYWQKEKFNSRMKERRDALAKREAKENVIKESTKLRKWLLEPNDKQHIPEELRTVVADFLSNIDFSSKTEYNGVKTQRTLAWEEALKAFNKIKESGQITDQDGNIRYVDVDPDLAKRIEELTEKTKGIDRLEELSAYDMEELLNTVRSMKSTITEINALKTNKKYGEVSLLAENVFADTDMMKNRKEFRGPLSQVDSLLNVKMMDPVTVFHKMGPAMESVYDSLTSGWDKKTKLLKEAEEYFKKSLEECGLKTKDIRAWTGKNPERHTFSLAGGDITLSTGQIMALYVLDKRSQARKHIYDRKGGIKAGDIDLGVSLKEKRLFPERQRGYKPIRVTADDVKTITDTLSADQKRLADKMQHFLGDNAAKWGNEASMQLYGYEKYKSKNYFPITTDKDYIMQPEGNKKESTIRNLGMTKSTNAYANNPIIVEDIFDVFTRHVDQMSSYNGLLVPLSDLHKLLNYKDARGLNDSSIQERIKATLGSNTAKYLDNLVDDINGSVHTRNDTGIADMLMGNMKAAAVAGNLRVAVQQPGSIARAYAELDAKYIARGLTKGANWDIITEYAPIAQWKDWGFYQMQVSRRMKDVLIDTDSAKDRFVNKTMFLAELGDQVTWKRLWNAVEYEIMDKHPDLQKGSEEFYTQVGRRFSEIIYKTQVADSVMLRTEVMRSTDGLAKMATAFMGEPLKTYNMLYRAVWDLKAGRMDKKTAWKNAGRVAAAFTANAFLTAAAAAAVDMFRDDDRDKKLNEKFRSHLATNMIDNVNILNNVPYIRDVISTIQGDTVKRTDMQGVQDVYYAWQKVYKVMQQKGKYTPQYSFLEAVRSTSALTGLPIKSITKDALAIIDTAVGTVSDSAGYEATKMKYGLSLSDNKSLYINMMMNAEDAGDQKLADKIKKDLLDAGYTEEDIEEQVNREVNKEIKDEVDIISAADQYDYTDAESKKKFEDEIKKYVELKKRAGKTEKEALTAVKTKLTAHFKELYQEGTTKEKNEIITRCNRLRYNGKAVYSGTEFKNWGKKKESKS